MTISAQQKTDIITDYKLHEKDTGEKKNERNSKT